MSQIGVRHVGDVAIVDLKGSFSLEHYGGILAGIKQLLDAGERKILLSMVKATILDDSTMGEIMSAYKRTSDVGGRLFVCGRLPLPFEAVLRMVHAFYPTEAEALASF